VSIIRQYANYLGAGLTAILALSCSDPTGFRELTPLEVAEFRWETRSFHSYTYEVQSSCFCVRPLTVWCLVEVDHDTISRVSEVVSGNLVPPTKYQYFDTIDDRFTLIHTLMNTEYVGELSVDYDSRYGYPTKITVVAIPNVADLDAVFNARNLQPIR